MSARRRPPELDESACGWVGGSSHRNLLIFVLALNAGTAAAALSVSIFAWASEKMWVILG